MVLKVRRPFPQKEREHKMKKKILYFYGGPEFHPTEWAGNKMSEIFKADGRFTVDMTFDLDALTSLPESGYDAVALYMTGFKDGLTAEREKGLLKFVKNGGGFVGIHSAADTFRDSRAYVEMLNGKFLLHPAHYEFKLSAVDKSHYVTARMPDFSVFDEMCHLQNHDASKSRLLIECASESYAQPVFAWRSDKKISGGVMYDWGAHFIDWLLNLVRFKSCRRQRRTEEACLAFGYK